MKIGTDGVLIGAWTPIAPHTDSILDIGTGTGLIALMMAQRCDAMSIDALDIDDAAFEQAMDNFEASPWGDRLYCYHASLAQFVEAFDEDTYDLIVSNPPFFSESYESEDLKRSQARSTSSLSFDALLDGVSRLLSDAGVFSVIIPFKEESEFIDIAQSHNLYLQKRCRVKGTQASAFKRSMLCFSFDESDVDDGQLVIEHDRHQYTQEYIDLTQEFYLKM